MRITYRDASPEDFDYCALLYFAGVKTIIRDLGLSANDQAASLREQWDVTQVRVILADGMAVGWLQSRVEDNALFLGQLFVDSSFQRQGIGSKVLRDLTDEAGAAGRAVTLGVVKTNPARQLYERFDFRITHEDERKFYMRREPVSPVQTSG
jgi:ribosomal protein S18 acetylase RimI-like enzyme